MEQLIISYLGRLAGSTTKTYSSCTKKGLYRKFMQLLSGPQLNAKPLLIRVSPLYTGVDATFTHLRQQYWILGARNLVRKIVFQCKSSFFQRKNTSHQIIGALPISTVQAVVFNIRIGLRLDYELNEEKGPRIGKAWFAIYVCLTTKVIYIEVVSDD